MSRWIFSRNRTQRLNRFGWKLRAHQQQQKMSINGSFVCFKNRREHLANIVLHPYLFTPNYFYSFHFWFKYIVRICFFFFCSHSCAEWNWSKALGILYFVIWRYIYIVYMWFFFLVPPKSTIHIWFHNAFCAHSYNIYTFSILSQSTWILCVSFSIIDTFRHGNCGGWRNMKKRNEKKVTTSQQIK